MGRLNYVGSFSSARPVGRESAGEVLGKPELIAGEKARSCADGQHAQMLPRADDARARPRPAPVGRRKHRIGRAFAREPSGLRIARSARPFPRWLAAGIYRWNHLHARIHVPSRNSKKAATTASIVLAFASVYFFWGSTYTAIRIGAAQMPALLLSGTRFLIAGAILLAWCRWRGTAPALAAENDADAVPDRLAAA